MSVLRDREVSNSQNPPSEHHYCYESMVYNYCPLQRAMCYSTIKPYTCTLQMTIHSRGKREGGRVLKSGRETGSIEMGMWREGE